MMPRSGLLVLATLAAAGCGAVLDKSEFKPLTPVEIAEIKAKADAEKNTNNGSDKPATASPASEEDTAKPAAENASAAPVVTAVAPEDKPKAPGLFASLFGSDQPPATEPTTAQPTTGKAPEQAAGNASAAETTLAKAEAASGSAQPTPPDNSDEVSEAELAGEDEADPDKIAVPKPPVDDGPRA